MKPFGHHPIQTKFGKFELTGFELEDTGELVIALQVRKPTHIGPCLTRIQFGCLFGTAFRSIDCDCGFQLDSALEQIAKRGSGVVIYYPSREAYGAGLKAKIIAGTNNLGKGGAVPETLRTPIDRCSLKDIPDILSELGIFDPIELLTNSEQKITQLRTFGVQIQTVQQLIVPTNLLSCNALHDLKQKMRRFSENTPSCGLLANFSSKLGVNLTGPHGWDVLEI